MHLGYTALSEGERACCTLDPRDRRHYVMREHKFQFVRSKTDAIHRMGLLGDEQVDPMTEAAIKLEVDFTLKLKTKNKSKASQIKLSPKELHDFMIMSTLSLILS